MSKLTARQKLFVQEYMLDLNATQAAIRAGYSAKTAEQLGYKLVQKSSVQEALQAKQQEVAKRNDVTIDRIIQELAAIAFTNLDEIAPWDERGPHIIDSAKLDRMTKVSVKKVTMKRSIRRGEKKDDDGWDVEDWSIEQHNRVEALVKLGTRLGMFPKEGANIHIDARTQLLIVSEGKL